MSYFLNAFKNYQVKIVLLLSVFFAFNFLAHSQNITKNNANTKEFVMAYSISINGAKNNSIQQTYNGGLKTVFVKNNLVRIRLVSLMRLQSIYFNAQKGLVNNVASLVKESGKDKSILSFNAKQWKQFNSRNDSMRCDIYDNDTLLVLGKMCKKAILTSKDSSKVIVYFLPNSKNNILAQAEPIFMQVPGLVLRYIVETKKKSIDFTAVDLRFEKIDNKVFVKPNSGYKKIKYNPNGQTAPVTEDEEEDETETNDAESDLEIKPTNSPDPKPTPP